MIALQRAFVINLFFCPVQRVLWDNTWYTNIGLILNKAIGDYFLQFNEKSIDLPWLKKRIFQILKNEEKL